MIGFETEAVNCEGGCCWFLFLEEEAFGSASEWICE